MEETRTLKTADPIKRIVAVVIDMVIAVLVALIPFIGGILAALYWLTRDGLDLPFMDYRSAGKKLVKIRPVKVDGGPMDIVVSVKRNWMLVLGVLLWPLLFIPILGWLLILVLVVPVVLVQMDSLVIELVLALTDDEGRRWGDRFADTRVIEVES